MPLPIEDGSTKINLADWNAMVSLVNNLETLLGGKASPEDISAALSALVTDAPTTLDTLGEIADRVASGDDTVTALVNTVGTKANTTDLTALNDAVTTHTNNTSAHGATAAATANRIAMRDANGKIQATTPVDADIDTTVATVRYVKDKATASGSGDALRSEVLGVVMQNADGTWPTTYPATPTVVWFNWTGINVGVNPPAMLSHHTVKEIRP